ncbi:MAG: aldose 1-epimerase family protein [Planctomycetes bacterium]|nr:aldose 1-epimerase family protein [Planctomycetota bacterium]
MATLFGAKINKATLLQHVGQMEQIAGAKVCELKNGPEKGVSAIRVKTGSGFHFTVLPDRGLDISAADFCGKSLCWRSATGDVAPQFFDERGLKWLYGFFGGLLTTCGLSYCGAPGEDQGEELGLHGRVNNTPAKNVSVSCDWKGDDYVMTITGQVLETFVFGPCLRMNRTITATMGESRLFVHDTIENIGYAPSPLQYLQHINLGYPAVADGAELLIPSVTVIPRDAAAENGKERYNSFEAPTKDYAEKCYYHKLAGDRRGYSCAAVVNRKCDGGFGAYIKFALKEFPWFNEWKQMGQGVYTVGLEPANCGVEGRAKDRARGCLDVLKPGQKRQFHIEIGALVGKKEIDAFAKSVKSMTGGKKPTFAKND